MWKQNSLLLQRNGNTTKRKEDGTMSDPNTPNEQNDMDEGEETLEQAIEEANQEVGKPDVDAQDDNDLEEGPAACGSGSCAA
jgi:hypothetical protein